MIFIDKREKINEEIQTGDLIEFGDYTDSLDLGMIVIDYERNRYGLIRLVDGKLIFESSKDEKLTSFLNSLRDEYGYVKKITANVVLE
ncbi:hypothetical protein [Lactobacillus sp.]|uniref:hypothetical protein n=1 Tax=Lactobacillus sp. TaxID=1591 RepID=UPI0019BD5B20|nr:hypothetical protein [Lactobacillus sp.]MBD5429692.1 hypothetical protein [Lactobacillus sp.]